MTTGAAGVVTPEGVLLQVQTAGPGSRMLAKGLDLIIQFVAVFAFAVAAAAIGGGGSTPVTIADLFAIPLIIFGYPAFMEAGWHGRTLGKATFRLRVVTREGGPVRFRHAIIRSLLYVIDGFLLGPVIGVVMLLATRETVRVGDLAAGTVVVREGTGAAMPTATRFAPPPGWEQYAQHMDVGRLTPQDYELVRSFLLRAASLRPDARWALSVQLAGVVTAKMGAGPPPGLHPEGFLACAAAAYQWRQAPYQYGGAAAQPWSAAPAAAYGPGWPTTPRAPAQTPPAASQFPPLTPDPATGAETPPSTPDPDSGAELPGEPPPESPPGDRPGDFRPPM